VKTIPEYQEAIESIEGQQFGDWSGECDEISLKALQAVDQLFSLLLSASARHTESPSYSNIAFGFVPKNEINAYAFSQGRKELIGCYTGLVFRLYDLFLGLLSVSNCFPEFGISSKESTSLIEAKEYLLREHDPTVLRWGQIRPNCEERQRIALDLGRAAVIFVLLHEVGHITGGHLEHPALHKLGASRLLLEYDRTYLTSDLTDRDLRFMEVHADTWVARVCHETISVAPGTFFPYASGEAELFLWHVAVIALFRFLDLHSSNCSLDDMGSHPLASLRANPVYLGPLAFDKLKEHREIQPEEYMRTYHQAQFNVTQAWNVVALPSFSFALDEDLVTDASAKLVTEFWG